MTFYRRIQHPSAEHGDFYTDRDIQASNGPFWKTLLNIRTGSIVDVQKRDLEVIKGFDYGQGGGQYNLDSIVWIPELNDYGLIISDPYVKNHMHLAKASGYQRPNMSDYLVTEKLVNTNIRGAVQSRVDKWGDKAVRGVENLIVGRAYRHIYGKSTISDEAYDKTIIVVTSVGPDWFDFVRLEDNSNDWRVRSGYSLIGNWSLVDCGVKPMRDGSYNCNWLVPAEVKPN